MKSCVRSNGLLSLRCSLLVDIHFKNLRGDLFAGLTAGVAALPLALA